MRGTAALCRAVDFMPRPCWPQARLWDVELLRGAGIAQILQESEKWNSGGISCADTVVSLFFSNATSQFLFQLKKINLVKPG